MITTREQNNVNGITREQLRAIPITTPKNAGTNWQGIQHGFLADTIHSELEHRAITVKKESWHLAGKNDSRLAGSLNLTIPSLDAPEGMDFCLGVHHSNDTYFALKFVVGTQIFVCSNGMVSGDFLVRKLHTFGLNLTNCISDGIDKYLHEVRNIGEFITDLKTRPVQENTLNKILTETGRQNILPWSRIGKIDKEFHYPSFSEFNERSAWGLYGAFTYVVQKSPAHEQMRSTIKFRNLLINETMAA